MPFGVAVRLLAMLLFVWQALAVQAHWHEWPPVPAPVHAVAGSIGPAQSVTERHEIEDPISCALCRAAVSTGHFFGADAPALVPGVAAAPWLLAPPLSALFHVASRHGWRSRAPPVSPLD